MKNEARKPREWELQGVKSGRRSEISERRGRRVALNGALRATSAYKCWCGRPPVILDSPKVVDHLCMPLPLLVVYS
ncbi:hypothetical protein L484_026405 [Morus notabilis]|uniref:Uncharacterized protein n=1 Tax=Morus notabilis TaxID=981085 RepID=W9RL95_9ROSA|nr:hypothetical protein L484_026405 [Morus notabilis]